MNLSRLAVLAAVLFAPLSVSAADLPVTYTVEEKPLKAAVAGTPLTFELYTDTACSGPVAHHQVVNIEDAELIVRLKPFNPKNATKKPNAVELRKTLTAVNNNKSLFLKVVGTGVVPVGSICQAQGAIGSVTLPSTTVTIRFGLTHPSHWGIENPPRVDPRLRNPTSLEASNVQLPSSLVELSLAQRYSCLAQFDPAFSIPTNYGDYLSIFALDDCTPVSCSDNSKNGGETDIDCGGVCAQCAAGKTCIDGSDCISNVCSGSVCQP